MLRMERSLLRRFDTVSTISGRMIQRLLSKGVVARKARYFPNWVDLARIKPPKNGGFRAKLGISSDVIVVLFSGTLGGKQGLMVIPEAARLLATRRDISAFVVCGDGVMKPQLESAAAGLANVKFMPLQPSGRVSDMLGMADIHLLPQSPDAADLVPAVETVRHAGQRPAGDCDLSAGDGNQRDCLGMRLGGGTGKRRRTCARDHRGSRTTRKSGRHSGRRGRSFAEKNLSAALIMFYLPGKAKPT